MSKVEQAQTAGPWLPYTRGYTALDFGSRYLFANPDTREIGLFWAHSPPPAATVCIKLADLLEMARAALTKTEERT